TCALPILDKHIVDQVRYNSPLIHHLTNQVVMNFTANGLLAFGGSPIMAKEPLEMNDIARNVDGILINIGTLTEKDLQAMLLAGKIANKQNSPIGLDRGGGGASECRSRAIEEVLDGGKFTMNKRN